MENYYIPEEDEYTAVNMNMHYAHNWVFHYNIYNDTWAAIPRDKYSEYWNNANLESVLRSKDLDTLFYILQRTDGDAEKIEQLVNKYK